MQRLLLCVREAKIDHIHVLQILYRVLQGTGIRSIYGIKIYADDI